MYRGFLLALCAYPLSASMVTTSMVGGAGYNDHCLDQSGSDSAWVSVSGSKLCAPSPTSNTMEQVSGSASASAYSLTMMGSSGGFSNARLDIFSESVLDLVVSGGVGPGTLLLSYSLQLSGSTYDGSLSLSGTSSYGLSYSLNCMYHVSPCVAVHATGTIPYSFVYDQPFELRTSLAGHGQWEEGSFRYDGSLQLGMAVAQGDVISAAQVAQVPEPATIWLCIAGIIAVFRRRRHRIPPPCWPTSASL